MSFGLYVWHDPDGATRGREGEHYEAWDEAEDDGSDEPDPRVVAFLTECERRWPWADDDSAPWSDWPLLAAAEAYGAGLAIRWSMTGIVPEVAALAVSHGLTVYEPQEGRVWRP
jgi:hypothetical protein